VSIITSLSPSARRWSPARLPFTLRVVSKRRFRVTFMFIELSHNTLPLMTFYFKYDKIILVYFYFMINFFHVRDYLVCGKERESRFRWSVAASE
jgi:hypothetical protein